MSVNDSLHFSLSYTHLHGNGLVRAVVLDDKVLGLPPVDAAARLLLDLEAGEVPRLARELLPQRVHVVDVDVRVAHDVRQAARHQVRGVCNHVRQQRVAGNVEGHAQAHVAGPLVELAVQVALGLLSVRGSAVGRRRGRSRVGDVELGKHVAGRQGHLLQVGGVPGAHDDAAVVGVRAELMYDLGELVDALARVVGAGVLVLGAKVAPLEAVDGAQVADLAVRQAGAVEELARSVAVPDLDAGLGQRQRRRAALDEPQQLRHDGLEKDALCRQQRQDRRSVVVERELEGAWRKDAIGSCSCSFWKVLAWTRLLTVADSRQA